MKKKSPHHVFKASAATQIATRISLLQRKAFNVLLANAYSELPNPKIETHRMSLKDLCLLLEYNSNDIEYLKNVLRGIRRADVEYNILHKDRTEWGNMGLMSQVVIENTGLTGEVIYSFAPLLRERLYNPAMYIRLNLALQNRFNSKYALILYEVCLDYLNLKTGYGETPYIELPRLRTLLGIAEEEYPKYKELSRRVIQRGVKEINDFSKLMVATIPKRKGRKIHWLKFKIKLNKENLEKEAFLPPKINKERQLSLLDTISREAPVKTLSDEFGVSTGASKQLVKKYDKEHINTCLEQIRDQIRINMKINNLGGYTRHFIEKNYIAKSPEIIERVKLLKQEKQQKAVEKVRQQEEEKNRIIADNKRRTALVENLKRTDPDSYSELRKLAKANLPASRRDKDSSIELQMHFGIDEFLEGRK